MQYVGTVFLWVLEVFQIPISLFGYTFSLWQVFLYTAVAGVIVTFISEAFFDG